MPTYVVGVSSGVASAFTWSLAQDRYGRDNVVGLFADVNGEDVDNYRFLEEVKLAIGGRLVKLGNDGREIWDVFEAERFLGNTRVSVCSRILKFEACRDWILAHHDPAEVVHLLGIDWTEEQRLAGYTDTKGRRHSGAAERWAEAGIVARSLMIEDTLDKTDALKWLDGLGIEPPILTRLGFPHANCMGGCVRSGAKQFKKLLAQRPAAYAWWEAGEERIRAGLGDYSILRDRRGGTTKPLPLRALRLSVQSAPTLFDDDDQAACGCFVFDDSED